MQTVAVESSAMDWLIDCSAEGLPMERPKEMRTTFRISAELCTGINAFGVENKDFKRTITYSILISFRSPVSNGNMLIAFGHLVAMDTYISGDIPQTAHRLLNLPPFPDSSLFALTVYEGGSKRQSG
jgi:hypothetical protein